MQQVLVVEDDAGFRDMLSMHLEDAGYRVAVAASLAAARPLSAQADALLLDQRLPDGTGLDFLQELRAGHPRLPVIMITGMNDSDLAIAAIKAGAYDYIRKPLDIAELDTTLRHALHAHGLARKVEVMAESGRVGLDGIVGGSRAILEVCKTIGRVAPTRACVLITGETGTGKEVVARAIHSHSDQSGLFLPINCSAIVETLLENELFGHEKGSFTGATEAKAGRFELAHDGTLFLDEIGDLPLSLQAKLLRVLQEGSFERVGGNRIMHSNARIVAATHRDLSAMVAQGAFREDLFYRLNVVALHLPPLRERAEDLPALVEHLLVRIARQVHKRIGRISQPAWRVLAAYPWPGNVRELENVLTRAVVLARGDTLTPDLFNLEPMPRNGPTDSAPEADCLLSLEQMEARHVAQVLAHTHWHKGRACEILGISRPALERKLVKFGIG